MYTDSQQMEGIRNELVEDKNYEDFETVRKKESKCLRKFYRIWEQQQSINSGNLRCVDR